MATVGAMERIAALIAFSFVSVVTPGPNNVLLWASGAEFGLRRTARHVVGTAIGIGSMAVAVAVGIGAIVTAAPWVEVAMKAAGTVYLLYLAVQVAGASGLSRVDLARPLGLRQAAAFQLINPKAWIFAISAITTFRPTDVPVAPGSLLVAGTMMAVVLPTETLWAAAGGAIGRILTDDRHRRIVGLVLAALLVVTIVSVWL
jgi:threonine/homoserine/homoserine lactone efflux protein